MEKTMMMLLAAGIFVAAGCQQSQQSQPVPMQRAAQQAESSMSKAMDEVVPQAENVAQEVAPQANAMVEKAQALLVQAKELLDAGKFEEAIAVAQNVLSIDPANLDAQNIIAMAKEKLQAMVATQAADVKAGVMDTVGSLGQ